MRKSILMASFLLATLYACNQEEEALKTLKPTDGGEVMTNASGTLAPAELLAQDSLMIAYYFSAFPFDDPTSGISLEYFQDTLVNDSNFIAQVYLARTNLLNNYSGFVGMTEAAIDDLISDAVGIIFDGIYGPSPPGEVYDTYSQRKKYRQCIEDANSWLAKNSGTPDGSSPPSAPADELVSTWNEMKDDCCTLYPRGCRKENR